MWLYKDKVIKNIEDFPENTFGFIYKITNTQTGKFYIGKKQILSKTNIRLSKKKRAEIKEQTGKSHRKQLVIKESNWKEYWGSSKPLLEDIEKLDIKAFKREIIMFCTSKKLLTYWEAAYQIKEEVLLKDSYNDTILGRYYRKDFI